MNKPDPKDKKTCGDCIRNEPHWHCGGCGKKSGMMGCRDCHEKGLFSIPKTTK